MSSPRRSSAVHQLVHTLSYGDAISGEVFALRRCLRALGHESDIYAINVHPRFAGEARDYRSFREGGPGPDDADADERHGSVLLHYSLGSPLNDLYSRLGRWRRALVYHNITPAHWFDGVNGRVADDIRRGLADLPGLCAVTDLLLADSTFNAGELSSLGFEARVLGLPLDLERWSEPANAGIASLLSSDPRLHLLHVGRIAPNKRIEDVLKVFYFLRHHVRPESKLWIVGTDVDTELYSFALKRMTYELKLDDAVEFTGALSDAEVRAFYENCSAYLCMSEHEGFCLPVVEAMHFGLPVVSLAAGALTETVGPGGFLLREKLFPETACLVEKLFSDGDLRALATGAGRKRAAELSYGTFRSEVEELFPRGSAPEQ